MLIYKDERPPPVYASNEAEAREDERPPMPLYFQSRAGEVRQKI
jgi:hypothetical protein